ncbi:hypothetical protein [Acetobacterium sp.]|jgi:hypothetical protein|uniref:hypothetical protein n=1 Tax=Acetobacterium sp. TaxID=1872094 RepID=UPI0027174A90|nr:hypothetical protein [Acetobacterium sp.]MDO9492386.1 hypothetical protein [Acetobacterium sp.]
MENMKRNEAPKASQLVMVLITGIAILFLLTGCGESTPIEGLVISNEPYESSAEIGNAEQPTELSVSDTVYGSVSFIESPKGMKYQAKWLLDGKEIKIDEKTMETDKRGELVFPLEAQKLAAGTLKLQILYKDEVLAEKEVLVK